MQEVKYNDIFLVGSEVTREASDAEIENMLKIYPD